MKLSYPNLGRSANPGDHVVPLPRPSCNLEAEQAVLGSLMLANDAWHEVAAILNPQHFYQQNHQVIFGAIQQLAERCLPCDVVTLSEVLEQQARLDDAGGTAYLGMLARDTPSAVNVKAYAMIVFEHAMDRQRQAAAYQQDWGQIEQLNQQLAAVQAVALKEAWEDPEALPHELPPVAELNPALIPEPLRNWLMDIAERMQVPPDYTAAAAVVALGSLIGRKIGIHPKQRDDWLVVPNLWGAVVGRPALMKSPSIQEAIRPLNRLIMEAMQAYEQVKQEFELRLEVAAAEKKARKARVEKAAKAGKKGKELEVIATELIEDPPPPTLRRYMTQDGTVAAIGQLLLENPNGLLVLRDELVGLLRNLDKDGNEGDRAFYLEAWNGQGSFAVDRIGRGTLHVPALTLSLFGSIQPGPLRDYVYQSIQGNSGDDGLIQRFQVLVWPDAPNEWHDIDRWPNNVAKQRAFAVFQNLDLLTPEQAAIPSPVEGETPALRFTPEAQDIFNEWRSDLESRLRDGSLAVPALEAHLAKYRSLFPSLALIFHLVSVVDGADPGPVSVEAATLASAWCEYLETHARRLYAAAEEMAIESARALLKRLQAGEIKLTDGAFNGRDVYLKGWSRLSTPDELAAAVKVLEEFGWLRTEQIATRGRPRRLVRVHPVLQQDRSHEN